MLCIAVKVVSEDARSEVTMVWHLWSSLPTRGSRGAP